tara:strand:+ start:374 stop:919 length:546 start_codon:yes stop_codon:yes gene_type:complete
MTFDAFAKQISNRNFLSPAGFKFILARTPKVDFLAQAANIPEITLGTSTQPTYLKDIDIPGDKLQFGDFSLRFIVDEELENYKAIDDWMRGLAYPDSVAEYGSWIARDPLSENIPVDPNISDGTLLIYNSNFRVNTKVKFRGLFPVSLSTISFAADQVDVEYVVAEASFKYRIFDIESYEP